MTRPTLIDKSVIDLSGVRSLVVSNLRTETKGSRFESGC